MNPLDYLFLNRGIQAPMAVNTPQPTAGGIQSLLAQLDQPIDANESYWAMNSAPQNMGGPALPPQTVPTKRTSAYIQEQLGALEPPKPNSTAEILANRNAQKENPFAGLSGGTDIGDYSSAIFQSAFGKPTNAYDVAETRNAQIQKQLNDIQRIESMGQGGGGSSVYGQIMNEINNDPELSQLPLATKISIAKSGMGQGGTIVNGQLGFIPGYDNYKAGIRSAEQTAKNQSDLIYEPQIKREVEQQAVIGQETGKTMASQMKQQLQAPQMLSLLDEVDQLLPYATSGGLATSGRDAAGYLGVATQGSEADTQLNILASKLTAAVPRFEGPQGVLDVELYKQAAGDLANTKLPTPTRQAAAKIMRKLQTKYAQGTPQPSNNVISYEEYFK